MNNKDIIKIINEVYTEFDFLNNDKIQKNVEIKGLLQEEMFQKQFIVDSISYMGSKINIINTDFTYKFINDTNIELSYSATIEYKYNDDNLKFNIFIGDMNLYEIVMNKKQLLKENIEQYNINWKNLPVKLYTLDLESINFKAYKNESPEIKEEFVKAYIEDLVDNITNNTIIDDGYTSPPPY